MGVGIGLFLFGVGCVGWGGRYLFNVRGAADKVAARRNEVRAMTLAGMGVVPAEPSRFGGWFFRLLGGVTLPCGLLLGVVGLALVFG